MDEGGEPVLTDIMDFFLYCFMDPMYRWKRLGGRILPALGRLGYNTREKR